MKKFVTCILAACAMAFAFAAQAATPPEQHPQFVAATAVAPAGAMIANVASLDAAVAPSLASTTTDRIDGPGESCCPATANISMDIDQTSTGATFAHMDPGRRSVEK